MKKRKIKYFDTMFFPALFAFTIDEKEFRREMKKLGLAVNQEFVSNRGGLTTHYFANACPELYKKNIIIIAADFDNAASEADDIDWYAALTHEVEHAIGFLFESMGESLIAGSEIWCYALQHFVSEVIREFNFQRGEQ